MIDVIFEDNSKKKFVITEETTVGELVEKVCQKLYLQTDASSFALFDSSTTKSGVRTDRLLKNTDKVPKVLGQSQLLFKKRFFNTDNSADAVTLHMEYIQLRSEVIRGYYAITERDFLELAAIDLRITYGNPDSSKHKAGFLIDSKQLEKYVPSTVLHTKKPAIWEKLVLDEYQRIAFDPINSDFEGKVRYVQRLRDMCGEYFGAIFYDVTELTLVGKIIKDRTPGMLGITKNGIFTFQKSPKGQNLLYRSSTFQEITGWAMHPPTKTFIYTIPSESSEGVSYTYESALFEEIPSVCQCFVELIISQTGEEGEGESAVVDEATE